MSFFNNKYYTKDNRLLCKNIVKDKIALDDEKHLKSIKGNEFIKSDEVEIADISARAKIMNRVKKYDEDKPKIEKLGRGKSISMPLMYRAYLETFGNSFGNKSEAIRTMMKSYYIVEDLIKEYIEETFGVKNIQPAKSNMKNCNTVHVSSFSLGKKNFSKMDDYIKKHFATARNHIVTRAIRDTMIIQMLTNPKYSKKLREKLEALK